MPKSTKIVCIGAGSYSFGLTTLVSLLRSQILTGSEIVLVDHNSQNLEIIARLVAWLNEAWSSQMRISTALHHREVLKGANFVINAIEVGPREALWESDFNIPFKYGVRQPYAENSGPGGFAHAARNIIPVLEIAKDMEACCPAAWLINFTNPMQRICASVHRYTNIKVIGLCHQLGAGYAMVGKTLASELEIIVPQDFTSTHASPKYSAGMLSTALVAMEKVSIVAAGVNHFTWMLSLKNRHTGEDLYPLFRTRWESMPSDFEPLTRRIFNTFGLFPIPGDEHLCEYLPWVSDPDTKPWQKYDLELYEWLEQSENRDRQQAILENAASKTEDPDQFIPAYSEGALEVIVAMLTNQNLDWEAANLPNQGQISNLPQDAIVETPAKINADGAAGIPVGELPAGIAELIRREITISHLTVDAVVKGDRRLALQALLLDPVIRDIETAKMILDDYLETYRDHLPTFW